MRLCELRQKEVINICTCASLGCVVDVEFDYQSGCITALIVPGCSRFSSFWGQNAEIVIPWKCIRQIGKDIILVDVAQETKKGG